MKDIAVVICNFNKKEYLKECLDSLFLSDLDRALYDVIVVDNASTDGAVQMIREHFAKDVLLLENSVNTGGAGGFARGINHVLEKEYHYLALLDNDIKLEYNTISELQKYLQQHKEVGIVGSKICTMDQPDVLQELGSFIDMESFNALTPLKGHKDSADLPDVVECDYVPACCLLARMDTVRRIGAFDVEHFIYWDDMDWCTKARENGYKVHAISSSRVYHKMGAINTTNTFSLYYFERNRILFFLKHLQEKQLSDFTAALSKELINLTFFSNEKGRYNSAISQLLGIEDIFIGNLGREDKRVLPKEQTDPFSDFHSKQSYPLTLVPAKEMRITRKIYNDLSKFFSCKPEIAVQKEETAFFQKEFADSKIIDINSQKVQQKRMLFYGIGHIMEAPRNGDYTQNTFFIDYFLNIQPACRIESFLTSYEIYKDIFTNIFQPVLEEKFRFVHHRLHQK